MIQLVLATGGFYFSRSFDLSHSLQWLEENTTPNFKQQPMMERVSVECSLSPLFFSSFNYLVSYPTSFHDHDRFFFLPHPLAEESNLRFISTSLYRVSKDRLL